MLNVDFLAQLQNKTDQHLSVQLAQVFPWMCKMYILKIYITANSKTDNTPNKRNFFTKKFSTTITVLLKQILYLWQDFFAIVKTVGFWGLHYNYFIFQIWIAGEINRKGGVICTNIFNDRF